MAKSDISELLVKHGLVTPEQLALALREKDAKGVSAESALVQLGFITEEEIDNIRAATFGIPYVDLMNYQLDTQLLNAVPEKIIREFRVIPLFKIGRALTLGMVNPANIAAIDRVRSVAGYEEVEQVLISENGFRRVIEQQFGTVSEILAARISSHEEARGVETSEDAPAVKWVNTLFTQAIQKKASDIHLEPEEEFVRARFRIDGVLYEIQRIPSTLQQAIISRIKILSALDITESRKPQDGKCSFAIDGKTIDIRVSTFPTVHGENVVMRLLDKASVVLGLKELGFLTHQQELFNALIKRPYGIILVTGPTGNGKTTTLYAALSTINSVDKNIVTLEDPVEYKLPMVRHTQVNPKAGITFANGLRHILRQDPDVIMVGEIRDKETAEVAIQASLTGHLVLSTLHTNDAASALSRLIDMGIEPFLVASSISGILAQRLVRTICAKCKEPYPLPAEILKAFGDIPGPFYRGKGCPVCNGKGLSGRTGLFELLVVNEEIRSNVVAKRSAEEIKKAAMRDGMKILREDGIEKALQGITTPEEVLRASTVE